MRGVRTAQLVDDLVYVAMVAGRNVDGASGVGGRVDVVRQLADKGYLVGERQKSGGETYYMIHPLLRTLAIGYQKGELETFKLG